uniref:Uncharacterized protein n=1 Tax=Arundo donax TaxID=35708 RepID=A0A0A9BNP4_ARUDO
MYVHLKWLRSYIKLILTVSAWPGPIKS